MTDTPRPTPPVFEQASSPLYKSNDGRLSIENERETEPPGFVVVDGIDRHVELFTLKRVLADAYVAGYNFARTPVNFFERVAAAQITTLNQLIEDADVVIRNATERGAIAYYKGVRVGLERARTVLEGKG